MIHEGSPVDSIIIADFECSCEATGTNPGVRVYLRDGYLWVDRSKIGESERWYAEHETPITAGDWNDIEIRMIPGVAGVPPSGGPV
ncbi:MAG: hypothetical protein MK180_16415 [Rhodobacteraceae bacterium]|nr:hypothetical protein [Paracoccaceae bacterium]